MNVDSAKTGIKTYTSMTAGPIGFLQDARRLYKVRTRDIEADVETTLKQRAWVEADFVERTGQPLRDKQVLVVGGGQTSREVFAFGVLNPVTSIDLDVIPHGWKPGPYVRLLKQNGPVRTAKTVGRKMLGIDRQFRNALVKGLGSSASKPATFLQMNASEMTFSDNSFDLVYSFSVFEHLDDPRTALSEAIRVLRPGAVLSVSAHLYRAEGGCHDLRIFAGDRAQIPYWAHLRPQHKHTVVESCYMNEWSLDQWRELFASLCPGGDVTTEPHHASFARVLETELASLRSNGELAAYSDEDLLSVNVRCVWTKPVS
jgi:SAM-dependent methyltransferase